ncbi:MAG: hypothetical protein U0531_05390 [Dehalococcoidia bacterium]
MHRRVFLKVTGTLAVAEAVKALPAATAWRRDARRPCAQRQSAAFDRYA